MTTVDNQTKRENALFYKNGDAEPGKGIKVGVHFDYGLMGDNGPRIKDEFKEKIMQQGRYYKDNSHLWTTVLTSKKDVKTLLEFANNNSLPIESDLKSALEDSLKQDNVFSNIRSLDSVTVVDTSDETVTLKIELKDNGLRGKITEALNSSLSDAGAKLKYSKSSDSFKVTLEKGAQVDAFLEWSKGSKIKLDKDTFGVVKSYKSDAPNQKGSKTQSKTQTNRETQFVSEPQTKPDHTQAIASGVSAGAAVGAIIGSGASYLKGVTRGLKETLAGQLSKAGTSLEKKGIADNDKGKTLSDSVNTLPSPSHTPKPSKPTKESIAKKAPTEPSIALPSPKIEKPKINNNYADKKFELLSEHLNMKVSELEMQSDKLVDTVNKAYDNVPGDSFNDKDKALTHHPTIVEDNPLVKRVSEERENIQNELKSMANELAKASENAPDDKREKYAELLKGVNERLNEHSEDLKKRLNSNKLGEMFSAPITNLANKIKDMAKKILESVKTFAAKLAKTPEQAM